MVARVFTKLAGFEIRVSWLNDTSGYVNGHKFEVVSENCLIEFPNNPEFVGFNKPQLAIFLTDAVIACPEFRNAKRQMKAENEVAINKINDKKYECYNVKNGNQYNVYIGKNGTHVCQCPDHQNRGSECKHIRAVKSYIEKLQPKKLTVLPGRRVGGLKRAVITDEMINEAKASLGW